MARMVDRARVGLSAGFTGTERRNFHAEHSHAAHVALLLAATAIVQAQERPMLTVTVPFAFTVENINLPAGSYTVFALPPYSMTVKLQGVYGQKAVMIRAIPSRSSADATQGKLLFSRIGNEYFLSQVWEQGSKVHRDFFLGNRAKELARNRINGELKTLVAVTAQ
jgi:hypothetical protein